MEIWIGSWRNRGWKVGSWGWVWNQDRQTHAQAHQLWLAVNLWAGQIWRVIILSRGGFYENLFGLRVLMVYINDGFMSLMLVSLEIKHDLLNWRTVYCLCQNAGFKLSSPNRISFVVSWVRRLSWNRLFRMLQQHFLRFASSPRQQGTPNLFLSKFYSGCSSFWISKIKPILASLF